MSGVTSSESGAGETGFRRGSRCTTGACVLLSASADLLRVRGNDPQRELSFPAAARGPLLRAITDGLLAPDR
ncbi:hypothetical protein [Actinokineospora terrae]|uniref:DUF397 domain-containing protein n=1 Tax=Actinokineospora terrae TaxID=155974 RepID=A0A1H9PFN5_9PSEU|nr:hypothetical protein [Actinokineospora terrae]SER47012.1 hypothetical protein SAMN04487818_103434 [Actinokineospora terrae]